jgi:amino acid adenylation domain-containing protein
MVDRAWLSPTKQALLDRWLQGKPAATNGAARIPPRDPSEPVPLSFQQYRLWFLDQLAPGGAFANIDLAIRLDFPLDPRLLAGAINEIIKRHETLRTTFAVRDGEPVQIIAPELTIDVPVIDLRPYGAKADARATALATEEARRPFDLASGPLIRATAIRLAAARWVLALTIHHIVADGWSMRIFFDELAATYEAIGRGKPSAFPPLSVQYGDFAVWQRKALGGDQLAAHIDYWTTQLRELPLLELQPDLPRPPIQTFAGATYTFSLSAPLVDGVRRLATHAGASLFMGLLTGFAALLNRYTGQVDLPIATYTAGRTRTETEPMIGFFVNTLALRVRLDADPSFSDALTRVREVALEAYAHEEVPFERLVEALAPPRDPSRNPLVQVAFQLVNLPVGHANGSSAGAMAIERGTANFDLCWSLMENGSGGVSGRIEYSTDLFEVATIDRMARHYQRLLQAAVAEPERPLVELEFTTNDERARLASWNATQMAYEPSGLAELFSRRVHEDPAAPAIVTDSGAVTYAELDRRSNALAHELVRLGIEAERIVGVFLERSVDLFVAAIAIAKAGGAYLALDPSYPADRLAEMAQDAPAMAMISCRRLRDQIPPSNSATLLIDEIPGDLDTSPLPLPPPGLDRLCYVIYTSGSTGAPKGVAIEEAQVINRLRWGWEYAPFRPGEISVVRTPTNFVDSLWELWGPLLAGSPTVIAPSEARVDPSALIAFLARHRVTRIWLVPSLLQAILDVGSNLGERLPALTMWVLGGEPLPGHLVSRFLAAAPNATLYNSYGISEIWDGAWHRCAPGETVVPIGKPIANMQCLVLDHALRPTPIGVPGELCIAGIGIAREYLHRPELTADRFVPYPDAMGGRIYRTGDRARWRADGLLECLGRLDQQVKVRGVRIESAEVEAALLDVPEVAQAAVRVWPDQQGWNTLVAYVVPAPDCEPTLPAIRRRLGKRLPDPMIPTVVIPLEQFPRTPSGKLDRRALPPPQEVEHARREVEAPTTKVEEVLLSIWREVLGANQIGVRDNFFDLGGHSLLATQIVSRIRSTFDIEMPLQTFFNVPSIAGLAQAITEDPSELERLTRAAEIVLRIAALSDEEVMAMLAGTDDAGNQVTA